MAETHSTQSHSESTRFYWIVAAVLAVITVVEVVVTFLGLPDLVLLAVLMVLSVIKGASVVMFFMHLRGDPRVFQLLFIGPFALATSMIVAFLAIFSNYVGIGG
jgi:cytochrome c oxidase subunit IV